MGGLLDGEFADENAAFVEKLKRAHVAEVDRAMRLGYSREEAEMFVAMAWNNVVAGLRAAQAKPSSASPDSPSVLVGETE